jgi:ABC-2 type transport system ATP-binding protein
MIHVDSLTKRYGDRTALHGLTFAVSKGQIVGFLGPNGAGKSTTLRILAGFLERTSGSVKINGHDIEDNAHDARASIGYMPEGVPLYGEMRVAEYLKFRAELKSISRSKQRALIGEAMEKAQLLPVANVTIQKLSKGFRQRVGLADALLAKPPLLILDEPTAGLDPNQVLEVRQVLANLGADHTVLISTHILSEVEALCQQAIVIHKGKLVAQGTLADIRLGARPRKVRIVVRAGESGAALATATVRAVPGVSKVKHDSSGELLTLQVQWPKEHSDPTSLVEQCVRALVQAEFGVREVSATTSLEQVFAELTKQEPTGEAET